MSSKKLLNKLKNKLKLNIYNVINILYFIYKNLKREIRLKYIFTM